MWCQDGCSELCYGTASLSCDSIARCVLSYVDLNCPSSGLCCLVTRPDKCLCHLVLEYCCEPWTPPPLPLLDPGCHPCVMAAQGPSESAIPLLQLPHFDQDLLKRLSRKQVRALQDLFLMLPSDRRDVFTSTSVGQALLSDLLHPACEHPSMQRPLKPYKLSLSHM